MRELAGYYHRPPDLISHDEVQQYLLYLVKERQLSPSTCRLQLNGIRFFFVQVLKQSAFNVGLQTPKRPQRIPDLLTRAEVSAIIGECLNTKHKMILLLCYGCGLRLSELVAVKVGHIDGDRHLLRVEQGK